MSKPITPETQTAELDLSRTTDDELGAIKNNVLKRLAERAAEAVLNGGAAGWKPGSAHDSVLHSKL